MDDFENLEKLRVLAQTIEGDSTNAAPEENDIPVEVIDRGLPSDAWTKDGQTVTYIRGEAKPEADPIRGGNSGNYRTDYNALLEKCDGDPEADKNNLEECLFKGMNFKRSVKDALCKTECDNGCKCIFDPGTVVKPTKGGKSIYIVKNNDGEVIICAKPTNIEADMARGGSDGCWPQFSFQQDDIEPLGVDLATLAVLADIVAHNDKVAEASSACACPDGQCGNDAPENFEHMRELMENIYGPLSDEQLRPVNKFGIPEPQEPDPDEKKFDFDGPQGYFGDYANHG